jgi:hypothetical protein
MSALCPLSGAKADIVKATHTQQRPRLGVSASKSEPAELRRIDGPAQAREILELTA